MKDDAAQVSKILSGLRPAMQADGGDVELVSVECGVVSVKLTGTCTLCPSAGMTMKHGVERTLREALPWVIEVIRIP
ncbi:MAG TPA: NifU family protein [Terriglobia bacterium]|nr:NifU family protein [Terriglobia bacterium]